MKTSTLSTPTELAPFLKTSIAAQLSMAQVIRWEKYRKNRPTLREQSTLEHAYSFAVWVSLMCLYLREQNVQLDFTLIQAAANLHDLPEGELNRDVSWDDKAGVLDHDVQEYLAFCATHCDGHDKPVMIQSMRRAFLLQFTDPFGESDYSEFPDDAQRVLKKLADEHPKEAALFQVLEAIDHLFLPLEHMCTYQDPDPLVWTLRRQVPRLAQLVKKCSFVGWIWSHPLREWAQEFLREHESVPDPA